MATSQHLKLRGYTADEGDAVVEVERLRPGQRFGRAVAGFGIWFLAAAITALIPVAHLLLVPACLIGAFITLVMRASREYRIVSARGNCPACGTEQPLELPGSLTLPLELSCRNCHRRLTLHA